MTEECITPLRRRMIEDMTVRRFAAETQRNYIRAVKTFADLPRSIAGHGHSRRSASFSIALERDPRPPADRQLYGHGAADLFHRDARSGQRGPASDGRA